MPEEETGKSTKDQQVNYRKRPAVIIRILRAFKRCHDRGRANKKPKETDHQRNERLVAESSQRIGLLTIVIAIAAVLGVVVSVLNYLVVQGQLEEMKSGSAQTDKLVSASIATAQATANSVQAFVNSERGEVFTNQVVLVKNGDTDPTPKVNYSLIDLGKGPIIFLGAAVDCRVVSRLATNPTYKGYNTYSGESAEINGGIYTPPPVTCDGQITPQDWTKINNGAEGIFFSGYVVYRDEFHIYRWRFGFIEGGKAVLFTTWTVPPQYNGEDQEN